MGSLTLTTVAEGCILGVSPAASKHSVNHYGRSGGITQPAHGDRHLLPSSTQPDLTSRYWLRHRHRHCSFGLFQRRSNILRGVSLKKKIDKGNLKKLSPLKTSWKRKRM